MAALVLAAVLLPVTPASGQNVLVDRGTFILTRNGEAIGTETFTIRQSGSGDAVKLVGTGDVSLRMEGGRRNISTAVEASGPGAVVTAYQIKESGAAQSEIYMTLVGRRLQARIVTPRGEQVREYRANPALVLLEEWMAHPYFFVVARFFGPSTTVPALIPSSGEQTEIRITDAGIERIQIAGQNVQSRHLRMEAGNGVRNVWTDDQGRILQVVNERTGFRAERGELPS